MSSSSTVACPFCQSQIGADVQKCRHCGEWVARDCEGCGTPIRAQWAARGLCAECQRRRNLPAPTVPVAVAKRKSRGFATFAAIFFGGIGLHRFYLGNFLAGFIYLLFCWTLIPSFAGIIEGIRYALMDDFEFQRRYGPF